MRARALLPAGWLRGAFLMVALMCGADQAPAQALNLIPGETVDDLHEAMIRLPDPDAPCPDTGLPLLTEPEIDTGGSACVVLRNAGDRAGTWRVDYANPYGGGMALDLRAADGTRRIFFRPAAGDEPAEPLTASRRLASLPVAIGLGESVTLIATFTAPGEVEDAAPSLRPEAEYVAAVILRAQGFALLCGAYTLLIGFVLAFARLLGSRPAAWYALYLTASALSFAAAEGYLNGLVPGRDMLMLGLGDRLLDALLIWAHLAFVAAFLRTARPDSRAPRALSLLGLLCALALLAATAISWASGGVDGVMRYHDLSFLIDPLTHPLENELPEQAASLVALAWLCALGAAAVLVARSRADGALSFASGAAVLWLGVILHSFGGDWFSALDTNQIFLPFAFLLDGLLFAVALVRQAFGLRADRDAALVRELQATRDRARLSEAALDATRDRDRARAQAEQHRARLELAGHDLRQPLATLHHAATRAAQSDPALGAKLTASLDYLRALLEDTLAVPDGDPAPPAITAEPVPLALILSNALRMFADDAQAKGLDLRAEPTELSVHAEPVALIRMVSNLVSNAVKYTDAGSVTLRALPEGDRVTVEVIDTGPGLSQAEIAAILQHRQRGPAAAETEGEGIGLSSVQQQARAAGLALRIRSVPGRGSVFALTGLPPVSPPFPFDLPPSG